MPQFPNVTVDTDEDDNTCVYILRMLAPENRFNADFCAALSAALDWIDADMASASASAEDPGRTDIAHPSAHTRTHAHAHTHSNTEKRRALVTIGTGRFFSNGLDLTHLLSLPRPRDFLSATYEPLMQRMLTLGMPTVAAVNGHAFAAGMILALVHDYRLMRREGRGLWSMNELLIKAAIPAGMLAVLRAKLDRPALLRECIRARRWTAPQALGDRLVDSLVDGDDDAFLLHAVAFARERAVAPKFAPVLHGIKKELYRDASTLLLDPTADVLDPFRFVISARL